MEKSQKILLVAIVALVFMVFMSYLSIPDLYYSLFSGESDINIIMASLNYEYRVNGDEETCTITGLSSFNVQRNITIPSKIGKYTVIAIGDNAFANTRIKTVTIPSTLRTIGSGAFEDCQLMTNIYGLEDCDNILQIPNYAFKWCASLQAIDLPSNLIYIGKEAFYGCYGLQSVEFPSKLKKIDDDAFAGCKSLSSIVFSDSITTLGATVFKECNSISELVLPNSVEGSSYYWGPFVNCQSLVIIRANENNSYVSVVDNIIYNKDLTTIWCYPSGKTDKEFCIPEGITEIGRAAFAANNHLESLTIPNSVELIYQNAFTGSLNIKQVHYNGTVKEWQAIKKYNYWRESSSDFIIYCTDGQITKDGTVTYK